MSWQRIKGLFTRRREDRDLIEEIEFHRAAIQSELESKGMSEADARDASRRAMGNVTLAREDAREVWIARWADQCLLDLRCGVRSLLHQPLLTLSAILATALGIATTTTVFSVADAELWKPLPYAQPEHLYAIVSRSGTSPRAQSNTIPGPDLLAWREVTDEFSSIASSGRSSRQVLQLQTAESVRVTEVTANYFITLGHSAVQGRLFMDEDARGERRLVITDRAWLRIFAADPAVIGRSFRLDEAPAVIVGVVRADDSQGLAPDFFLAFDEDAPAFLDRDNSIGYSAIARLKPGASVERARTELQALASQAASQGPGRNEQRIEIQHLDKYFSRSNWRPFYFFLGASLVVLALSTVNVATLLLSRAMRRAPEFALRRALGGGTIVLARQLFVEGVMLAAAGGLLGILFASWAIGALSPLIPREMLLRGTDLALDLRAAAFSLSAVALATVVFGLVPLPLARRAGAVEAMRSGARAGQPAREGRTRGALLVVQVALTLVMLAGSGMFLRSFTALTQVPLGFDPDNLAALRVTLSGPRYADDAAVRAYAQRLIETAAAFPGARAATVTTSGPLGSGPPVPLAKTGQPRPEPGDEERAIIRSVGADYFSTVGIPIVAGRGLSRDDGFGAARVAVINVTLAKRMFGSPEAAPGQMIDQLSGRVSWANRPGTLLIVGVASNIKEVGINEVDFGGIYVPFDQLPARQLELIARTGAPPDLHAMRARAAAIDPLVPIISATTFEQRVDSALAADVFNLVVVTSFAAVAILLSMIGIYAAAAYHVQSRTHELGVRLALGGRPVTLIIAAMWQTARPVLTGAAAGVVVLLVLARIIGDALYLVPGSHNGVLFGVTTTDPLTIAGAFIGLQLVALVAAGLPARQITRIDPVRSLGA
jgi:putative ABC transport system permease protein